VVHHGEQDEPAQDQETADSFPFPGNNLTDDHRHESEGEQVLWKRTSKWDWDTLANGKGGDFDEEGGPYRSGCPAKHGHNEVFTEKDHCEPPFVNSKRGKE
jgi:hypothetical protein